VSHTSAFFLNGLGVAAKSQAAITWINLEPNPWFDVLAVFNTVILAAVCEEALFRGFLLRGLKRVIGGDAAIIVSAALFALGHDSYLALLPIFSFGLILGYVYDRTGSLWVPIGFHAAFNAFTMTILLLDKHHLI
jgi:membrane protease YdiL (CAAX protease family)